MNDAIRAYTAGLFDGEGSVCLSKNHSGAMRSPEVTVTSTTFALVEYLKLHHGGSIVARKTTAGWKQAYIWSARYDAAIDFLDNILPWMQEPEKIHRGNLIVHEYKSVTPRNGKYTLEMTLARKDFEKRFFEKAI